MDGQPPSTSMDTSPLQSCDASASFARSACDVATHLLHEMPVLFQSPTDPPSVLTNVLPVSVADVLTSPSQPLGPGSNFLPDFQSQHDAFGIAPAIDSDIGMNPPPGCPSVAEQQVTSPIVHPMNPGYAVSTSSLATALDNITASMSRSRAGSTTSPGKSLAAIAPGNYPINGSTIAPVEPSGVLFPPADFSSGINGRVENMPEARTDAFMVDVGHALGSIAGYTAGFSDTAHSASEACFVGQSAEVNVRFDELKKRWFLITELISKIDASLSLKETSPPHHHSSTSIPVNAPNPPALLNMIPQPIESRPMDILPNPDTSDSSRKRCASSLASGSGDRVIKAPKMEPVDDIVLPVATSPTKSIPLSPPHLFTPSAVSASSVVNRSLPPSAPPSRPPTPGTINVNLLQQSPHAPNPSMPPVDFTIPVAVPSQPAPQFPVGARNRSSWSDTAASMPHRHHQHSLSGTALNGAVNAHGLNMIPPTITQPFNAPGTFGASSVVTMAKQRPAVNGGNAISPPLGRITRSGSITTPAVNPLSFGFPELPNMESYDLMASRAIVPQRVTPDSDDGEDEIDDDAVEAKNSSHNHSSPESGSTSGHGNEVPQEYRAEVDRIFFEFLNKICSNLDASDSKGEPIHQTLMAKKMQRLDESPDFRPFKFRIAAFTNAFLEELARQGYPEEKIPMKKIRNYLWRQEYIQRFNEDGKKAKSKGNHIWNIDAKKGRDGSWIFRPFHRKLAGSPPGIAYVGLKWSWTPRIWDPQASSSHLPVHYSSPVLPHWLSWKEDVLSGTPPPDAESCDITADARFVRDGQEELLSLTFHLNIAPISTLDSSFSSSRRPSLATVQNPRRVQSDSHIPQIVPRSILRPLNPASQPPPAPSQGEQVMQVLTSAAQRVAQEAQCQVIASRSPINDPSAHELQALAKQQHVLTLTAAAFDKELTGQRQDGIVQSPSSVLAAAAHEVVLQAARSVRADRSAVAAVNAGGSPQAGAQQPVTVNEVSVATQSAVAQAVELTGPLSSEVDVLRTATSLLQHHTRVPIPPSAVEPTVVDPLPAATLPSRLLPLGMTGPVFPPSHGMPDYVTS